MNMTASRAPIHVGDVVAWNHPRCTRTYYGRVEQITSKYLIVADDISREGIKRDWVGWYRAA